MRLTLRLKILSIGGISAAAFLLLIVAGAVTSQTVEAELKAIQGRYLPLVELEPQLNGQFERVQRGFQDAVAAHDLDALNATRDLEAKFLRLLDAASGAVDARSAAQLRSAVGDYYDAGRDVSGRLIGGETGEAMTDAIAAMQAKQARTRDLIKETASLDRAQIGAAFVAATRAEATAKGLRFWIGVVCLVFVLSLSLGISRGLLRSLSVLSEGFGRFGRGDLATPIEVGSHDELADAALHANQMATSLERLNAEQKKAEAALKLSNRELEAFSYSVAHDLRAPLRGINGFASAVLEDWGPKLDDEAREYLQRIGAASQRMGELIDALLALSRVSRVQLQRETVSLSRIAESVVKMLRTNQPERTIDFDNGGDVVAYGDPALLRAVLENLLGNAWKFTGTRPSARIAFGASRENDTLVYFVKDNGAGFDMAYAEKLFAPFQRLHTAEEFAGTGIGLATVQRIIQRHGGRIWAEGTVGQGAVFHFTLGSASKEASHEQ